MTAPTKDYWKAKAELCLNLAIEQGKDNEKQIEALRNFNRYLIARQMIQTGEE